MASPPSPAPLPPRGLRCRSPSPLPLLPRPRCPKAAPAASGSGETVSSPMPGTILDVKVAAGQAVKSGDILVILEAMKMENEIFAPCDGTVSSVAVSKALPSTPATFCASSAETFRTPLK